MALAEGLFSKREDRKLSLREKAEGPLKAIEKYFEGKVPKKWIVRYGYAGSGKELSALTASFQYQGFWRQFGMIPFWERISVNYVIKGLWEFPYEGKRYRLICVIPEIKALDLCSPSFIERICNKLTF